MTICNHPCLEVVEVDDSDSSVGYSSYIELTFCADCGERVEEAF